MNILVKDLPLIVEAFENRGHFINIEEAEEIWSSYSSERHGDIWTDIDTVTQKEWNDYVFPLLEKTYTFQIIQVGNLYYSGMKQGEKDVRYYFSEKIELGFPIFIEDISEKLNGMFGGTILTRKVKLPEYVRLQGELRSYNQLEDTRLLNILMREGQTL